MPRKRIAPAHVKKVGAGRSWLWYDFEVGPVLVVMERMDDAELSDIASPMIFFSPMSRWV